MVGGVYTHIQASIIIFFLGIAVGSFLNVVIDRLPFGESIVHGRSHCDFCKHLLFPLDLFPVISFLFLGGRCRYCHKKLSWQYPAIELLTGSIFLLVALATPAETFIGLGTLLARLVIASSLIVIVMADLKYHIIPDVAVIAIICSALLDIYLNSPFLFINHISSGFGLFGIFLLLVLITKGKGMGMGDVKYAFAMGLLLGFPLSILGFYVSFLTGAIISLILVGMGQKTFKAMIPFGPFLVFSTVICLLFGSTLWEYAIRFIGL